jgi:very-short-patch-repair endonuclease
MVDMRMEALAQRQHGVISHAQARALGLTAAQVRSRRTSGRWEDVSLGVYRLVGSTPTSRQGAMAAVLGGGDAARASHTTASALYVLPGYSIEPIVISVPRRRRSLPGVRIEQSLCLPAHHLRIVDGIPCTSVARTLFDLCGDVHAKRAERTLDTALARGLVTLPALWRVLDDLAKQGRSGVCLLRALLMERGSRHVPPESELEARFLELVDAHSLPQPARQVDLGNADQWIGRVDFVWRDVMLVVEVDGAMYHDGLLDRRRDEDRTAELEAIGWTVLRFRWNDVVLDPQSVVKQVRAHLDSFRGASAS